MVSVKKMCFRHNKIDAHSISEIIAECTRSVETGFGTLREKLS